MTAMPLTLNFVAEEEGIGGSYRGSDLPFSVTLNPDTSGHLSIEGRDIALSQNWQTKGTKDGEAMTETSLTGTDRGTAVQVTVEQLDNGCARASAGWPDATPTREVLGFCDDWKSLT
jgi:hypothetical protein